MRSCPENEGEGREGHEEESEKRDSANQDLQTSIAHAHRQRYVDLVASTFDLLTSDPQIFHGHADFLVRRSLIKTVLAERLKWLVRERFLSALHDRTIP